MKCIMKEAKEDTTTAKNNKCQLDTNFVATEPRKLNHRLLEASDRNESPDVKMKAGNSEIVGIKECSNIDDHAAGCISLQEKLIKRASGNVRSTSSGGNIVNRNRLHPLQLTRTTVTPGGSRKQSGTTVCVDDSVRSLGTASIANIIWCKVFQPNRNLTTPRRQQQVQQLNKNLVQSQELESTRDLSKLKQSNCSAKSRENLSYRTEQAPRNLLDDIQHQQQTAALTNRKRKCLVRTRIKSQPRLSPPYTGIVTVKSGPYVGLSGYLYPTGTYGYSLLSTDDGACVTVNDSHVADGDQASHQYNHGVNPMGKSNRESCSGGQNKKSKVSLEQEEHSVKEYFLDRLMDYLPDRRIREQKAQVEELRNLMASNDAPGLGNNDEYETADSEEMMTLQKDLLENQTEKLDCMCRDDCYFQIASNAFNTPATAIKFEDGTAGKGTKNSNQRAGGKRFRVSTSRRS